MFESIKGFAHEHQFGSDLKTCLTSLGHAEDQKAILAECKSEHGKLFGPCLVSKLNEKYKADIDDMKLEHPERLLKCENPLMLKAFKIGTTPSQCRTAAFKTMKDGNGIISRPPESCLKGKDRDYACKRSMRDRLHFITNYIDQTYRCQKHLAITPPTNVKCNMIAIMSLPRNKREIANFI